MQKCTTDTVRKVYIFNDIILDIKFQKERVVACGFIIFIMKANKFIVLYNISTDYILWYRPGMEIKTRRIIKLS